MGKKDKKTDKDKQIAKQLKKQLKSEKVATKRERKEKNALENDGEEDIEKILKDLAAKEKEKTAVTVTVSLDPPSARANCTMTALPNGDVILFGGEFCDGQSTVVYNDLYRWNVDKNEWKHIESPNSPPPRCSHQSVFYRDQGLEKLFVFGGEFATLDQFHHYNDLWELDLKTYLWTPVRSESGVVPSPRSGHRMVSYRGYLVLFGGFYEALRDVKWFNDLFLFSFQERKWIAIENKPHLAVPRARSGFQMCIHGPEDTLFVFGGFSKEKMASLVSISSKNTVHAANVSNSKAVEGRVHEDMWCLHLKHLITNDHIGLAVWQKVSRKGEAPSARCGSMLTLYRNKALLFGGVSDAEGPQHSLKSVFFNDLFAFDLDRKRWFQLGVKSKSKSIKTHQEEDSAVLNALLKDNSCEHLKMSATEEESDADVDPDEVEVEVGMESDKFGYIDECGNVTYIDLIEDDTDLPPANIPASAAIPIIPKELDNHNVMESLETTLKEEVSKSPEVSKLEVSDISSLSVLEESSKRTLMDNRDDKNVVETSTVVPIVSKYFNELKEPSPRINPSLFIRGHTLFVYGGTVELGDVEVTLDDCWSLDLNRRDSWRCVSEGHMKHQVWRGPVEDDDTTTASRTSEHCHEKEDHEEDEDDEDSDSSDSDADEKPSKQLMVSKPSKPTGVRGEIQALRSQFDADNAMETPQSNESLREFYRLSIKSIIA